MPDARNISVVRVEQDGTQRLWRFDPSGGALELVLPDVKRVGYYAWDRSKNRRAIRIGRALGEPPTLRIAELQAGRAEIVATDIGRSLLPFPGGGISYVLREPRSNGKTSTFTIHAVAEPSRQSPRSLVRALGTSDPNLAWTPDGALLMAEQDLLYVWRPGHSEWKLVAQLPDAGLQGVTRLAVSSQARWIAFVTAAAAR